MPFMTGTGVSDTLVGSDSDDTIEGLGAGDSIDGGAGNDSIEGGDGNDVLLGGTGADTLLGGAGNDWIYGDWAAPQFSPRAADWDPSLPVPMDVGADPDSIDGGDGDDHIIAGYGDTVDGGAHSIFGNVLYLSFLGAPQGVHFDLRPVDAWINPGTGVIEGAVISNIQAIESIQGSNYDDFLAADSDVYALDGAIYGMGGDDQIIAGYYTKLIDGGDGNDILDARWSQYDQKAIGGAGDDTILGGHIDDGGDGNDSIVGAYATHGGDGDDTLEGGHAMYGDAGNDYLHGAVGSAPFMDGGAGDDTIVGTALGDSIEGGDGVDTAVFSGNFDEYVIVYDAASGEFLLTDDVADRDGSDTVHGVEQFVFADGTHASAEIASHFGTSGPDLFDGTPDDDVFYARNGDDTLNGNAGDDTLGGGSGHNEIDGGSGIDTLTYKDLDGSVIIDLAAGTAIGVTYSHQIFDTITGIENVIGSSGSDEITGDGGANVLDGRAGNDTLDGGAGADTLAGGSGHDLYFVDASSDVIVEFDDGGHDVVHALASFTLAGNVEDLVLDGSGDFSGVGNELSNEIIGNDGANVLSGLDGNDSVSGLGGDDAIDGGAGGDYINGDAGNDSLSGGGDSDVLAGGSGSDTLDGGDQGDWLLADGTYPSSTGLDRGTEHDVLIGGGGDDVIVAGYGDDVYGGTQDSWGDELSISFQGAGHGIVADFRILASQTSMTIDGATISGIERIGVLEGSEFDDFLAPMEVGGADSVYGFGGNDHIVAGDDTFLVDGGDGDDFIDAQLSGYASIVGGAGNDTIIGSLFNSPIDAGDGDDSIELVSNHWGYVDGGEGVDTVHVDFNLVDAFISYDASSEVVRIGSGSAGYDLHSVEQIEFADTEKSFAELAGAFQGSSGDDSYVGTPGNDMAFGNAGNDTMSGGAGSNFLNGGDGQDFVDYSSAGHAISVDLAAGGARVFGEASDTLVSIEGVIGSAFDDHISGAATNDTLSGGAGNDWLLGQGGDDSLDGGDGNDVIMGYDGADTIIGGNGNDDLAGFYFADPGADSKGNLVLAGAGNDRIWSQWGDTVDGGTQDDELWADYRNASSGVTADFRPLHTTGEAEAAGGTVKDVEAIAYVIGSAFDDEIASVGAWWRFTTIEGGAGNDHIIGDAWAASISGGDGNDSIEAGGTNVGGAAAHGDAGNDTIDAGGSTAYGDDGDDVLTGRFMHGGAGNDICYGEQASILEGDDGNDTLYGAGGVDELEGGNGNDLLVGDAIDYGWHGNSAADQLSGGDGDDTLEGGNGFDGLDGGAGIDTAVFTGTFDQYAIDYDAATGTFTVTDLVASRDETDSVVNVEYFQFADVLLAAGSLRLAGGAGNDTINGTAASDFIFGGAGNDKLFGGDGDDTLEGGAGNDFLNGGSGSDTASYAGSTGGVKVSLAVTTAQVTGGAGSDTLVSIENLAGGAFSDTLTGNAGANRIDGAGGNDTLNGGAAADTMTGGAGNDTYFVDNAGDVIVEKSGEGMDTVNSTITFTLGANVENLVLAGTSGTSGTGNELDNVLTGNGGANVLTGLDGNDTLLGGSGKDTIFGGDGDDSLDGGAGIDSMTGGAGNDTYVVDVATDVVVEDAAGGIDTVIAKLTKGTYVLGANVENLVLGGTAALLGTGNGGDNLIVGNAAANTLNGMAGNDTLDGGAGADVLTGGAGNDTFRFSTTPNSRAIDKITDFHAAEDRIALDHSVFASLGLGDLAPAAFQAGASSVASSANVHIIYNTATGALLYDADGAGGAAAVQFATIVPAGLVGTVEAAEFVVV